MLLQNLKAGEFTYLTFFLKHFTKNINYYLSGLGAKFQKSEGSEDPGESAACTSGLQSL